VIFKNENFIFERIIFLITSMQEPPLKTEWYEWNVWEPTLWRPGEIFLKQFFETLPRFLKDENKKEKKNQVKSLNPF
jgi:hypothetical protein